MSVKPILFNTDMVKAILNGKKTVTRRKIDIDIVNHCDIDTDGTLLDYENADGDFINPAKLCRYQRGDILYVRETFTDHWVPDENGKPRLEYCYKADDIDIEAECLPGENNRWWPSIHMPKEAARIWIKVKDVCVERLQDITNEGAMKEGASGEPAFVGAIPYGEEAIWDFARIWDSTIKKSHIEHYGWESNPWVWVISFERCVKPKEEIQ